MSFCIAGHSCHPDTQEHLWLVREAFTSSPDACLQGCTATICMPPTTTAIKIEAVKRLGGDIELVGQTYAEAQTHARVRRRADVYPTHAC